MSHALFSVGFSSLATQAENYCACTEFNKIYTNYVCGAYANCEKAKCKGSGSGYTWSNEQGPSVTKILRDNVQTWSDTANKACQEATGEDPPPQVIESPDSFWVGPLAGAGVAEAPTDTEDKVLGIDKNNLMILLAVGGTALLLYFMSKRRKRR